MDKNNLDEIKTALQNINKKFRGNREANIFSASRFSHDRKWIQMLL